MTEQMVALLAAEMDEAWDSLRRPLGGLTDEEFFWEPVPGCWMVHLAEDSRWFVDYADLEEMWPTNWGAIAHLAHLLDYGLSRPTPQCGDRLPA